MVDPIWIKCGGRLMKSEVEVRWLGNEIPGRRETGDGRWKTEDGRRETGDWVVMNFNHVILPFHLPFPSRQPREREELNDRYTATFEACQHYMRISHSFW